MSPPMSGTASDMGPADTSSVPRASTPPRAYSPRRSIQRLQPSFSIPPSCAFSHAQATPSSPPAGLAWLVPDGQTGRRGRAGATSVVGDDAANPLTITDGDASRRVRQVHVERLERLHLRITEDDHLHGLPGLAGLERQGSG